MTGNISIISTLIDLTIFYSLYIFLYFALVIIDSSKLKTVTELLEVQKIDLIELLDFSVSQEAEVSFKELLVCHVQLVRVEPLGLKNI